MDSYKRGLLVFRFLTFVKGIYFFSGVLVPFLAQWGRLSLFEIQLLQSWFVLATFLLEVPTGVVADRWGAKTSVLLSSLVYVVSLLLYGSYPHIAVFVVAETLGALASALISGADEALLYAHLRKHGKEAEMSTVRSNQKSLHLIGLLISAPVGSWVAQQWGLQVPMLLTAIPAALALVISLFLPDDGKGKDQSSSYWKVLQEGVHYTLTHRPIRRIALNAVPVQIAGYFVIWLYQPLMELLNIPVQLYGWMHAFLVVVQIGILKLWPPDSYARTRPLIPFTAIVVGISYLLPALAPSPLTLFLFITLAGGLGLTRREVMSGIIHTAIDSQHRATVLSTVSMFRLVAIAICNPIVGYLADQSLASAMVFVGLLSFSTLLFPLPKEVVMKE